jgi:arginyl-tRNA synthetase
MKEKLTEAIKKALKNIGIEAENISLEHPAELSHGDYSTNVALAHAKVLKMNPRELAEKIVSVLRQAQDEFPEIHEIQIAGAGFINFYLGPDFFAESIKEILSEKEDFGRSKTLKGKKIMVEYTDPNPFKPFHIGHLMTNAIGESVARIVEFSGAKTIRANYQGDIGPHVAKAIYALMKEPIPSHLKTPSEQAIYIGGCYAKGSSAYENDSLAKTEIETINKKIYDKSDEAINKIYDWGRDVTLEAFEEIYKMLGTKFDYYFFESDVAKVGEKIVRENMPAVFEESDGAIVFKGEKHDTRLHTRVFINSHGLPTYETKELGLTQTKFKKENPDVSIVTTAIEQAEYMKVVEKAISLIHPEFASRMKHITHGMMRFASGKMSSRAGNIVTGESLLRDAKALVMEKMKDREFGLAEKEKISEMIGVSALKYSILRQSIGGDIIYDFEKSISFEGDSGPYLQYTYTRIHSLLEKGKNEGVKPKASLPDKWESAEVEKLLYRFPEMVERALSEYSPHYIALYAIELARSFSAFYGNTKIVDKEDASSPYKMAIAEAVGIAMQNALYLLGVETPTKM